jgi:hypothetical protein
MDKTKYIGMDVHKEAISIAVLNSSGKLVMESTIETKACLAADTSSIPHQAATVDLQRAGVGDPR